MLIVSNTDTNSPITHELGQRISKSAMALSPHSALYDKNKLPENIHLELVADEIPEHRLIQAESFHHLFSSRASKRRKHLELIYNQLGRPDNIIVMMLCRNFLAFFENWLQSCQSHNIDPLDKLIVFCFDGYTDKRLNELGVKHYFFNPEYYAPAGKSVVFGDEWFRSTILYKNAVISDALTLGASVLFQDADLIWFKDPFIYLKETHEYYDIQIMYDGPNINGRPIYGNTGFIYLKSNPVTKALMETALRNSASILHAGQQQFIFMKLLNYFLCQQLIRLHILPEHLFLNGHLFDLKSGIHAAARHWKTEGIVLHYSWTSNRQEKIQKLNKFEINYTNITEISNNNTITTQRKPTKVISNHYSVILHLVDNESIEVSCSEDSPVLHSILNSYFRSVKRFNPNEIIHLKLKDDSIHREIYLKTEQISRIEITPPLSDITLLRIYYTQPHRLIRIAMRVRNLLSRIKRKLTR